MGNLLDVFRSPDEMDKAAQAFVDNFNNTQDLQFRQAQEFSRKRPQHQAVAACVKCGNLERHETQYKKHDYTNSSKEAFTDEWLARKCACCGYRWNEALAITK